MKIKSESTNKDPSQGESTSSYSNPGNDFRSKINRRNLPQRGAQPLHLAKLSADPSPYSHSAGNTPTNSQNPPVQKLLKLQKAREIIKNQEKTQLQQPPAQIKQNKQSSKHKQSHFGQKASHIMMSPPLLPTITEIVKRENY